MCASTRLLASLRWLCEQAAALWLEFATHPWGWVHACACFTTMATLMAASVFLDSNGCAASICGAWRLVAAGLWLVPRRV